MTAPAKTASTLAEALVAFHKDAPRIVKDAENPHFRSKFASLDSIMDAVRPKLADNGLVVSQHPCALDSGMPGLRTILLHSSGERLEDVMPLAVEKPGPQAQGSALTYARRYAVLAVLGLVADEDDDGNHAQASAEKPAAKSAAEKPKPATNGAGATREQLARINELGGSALTLPLSAAEKAALLAIQEELAKPVTSQRADEIIDALELIERAAAIA